MATPSFAWGAVIGGSALMGVWLGPLALLIVPTAVTLFLLLRRQRVILPLAVVLCVVLLGVLRGASVEDLRMTDEIRASDAAEGVVVDLPMASGQGTRAIVRVDRVRDASSEDWFTASADVLVFFPSGIFPTISDRVFVIWSPQALSEIAPGFGGWVQSLGAQGTARAWVASVTEEGDSPLRHLVSLRRELTYGLEAVMPGDAGALAAGIVTGDDSGLADDTDDAFRLTGTSHISAVSGANIAMLLAVWNMALAPFGRRRAVAIQIAIVATIWLYAVMVGLEPSAVRAAIVGSVGLLASFWGRRADAMTLLWLTLGGMALINPLQTQSISFWLSAAASLALITAIPTVTRISWRRMIGRSLVAMTMAQFATLPLVVGAFGVWSLGSLPANLLIAPLISLAFPLSFMLGGLVMLPGPVAEWFSLLPRIPLVLTIEVVTRISNAIPPFQLGADGRVAVVALGFPAVMIVAALSRDVERWLRIIGERWRAEGGRGRVVVVTGVVAGALLAVTRVWG